MRANSTKGHSSDQSQCSVLWLLGGSRVCCIFSMSLWFDDRARCRWTVWVWLDLVCIGVATLPMRRVGLRCRHATSDFWPTCHACKTATNQVQCTKLGVYCRVIVSIWPILPHTTPYSCSGCSVATSFAKVKCHTNVSITASTVPGQVCKDSSTCFKLSRPLTMSNEPSDVARPAWHPRKLGAKISCPAGEAGCTSGVRGFSLKQELQLDAQLYLHILRTTSFRVLFAE